MNDNFITEFFGIGIQNGKTPENLGVLWRSAQNLGASFISAHWDGTAETEEKIKDLTKATIRCIPLNRVEEDGNCVLTGAKSAGRVLFAKAY